MGRHRVDELQNNLDFFLILFIISLSCMSEEKSNVVNFTGFLKFALLINADALNYNRFCDFSLNELTLYLSKRYSSKESSSVL